MKDSRVTPLSSASTVNIIKNIPASSLNNTLITPLPSAGTTMPANLFRAKVTTPQIKGASGGAVSGAGGAAVIGATSGAGGAPQILGNIKLTSSSGGAATIKQVPSSALRNIKICSPNGKVFLQPGKLPAGSIIHKLNNTSGTSVVGTGGVVTTTTAVSPTNLPAREQRTSIQKMQILQPATASGNSGCSHQPGASSGGSAKGGQRRAALHHCRKVRIVPCTPRCKAIEKSSVSICIRPIVFVAPTPGRNGLAKDDVPIHCYPGSAHKQPSVSLPMIWRPKYARKMPNWRLPPKRRRILEKPSWSRLR